MSSDLYIHYGWAIVVKGTMTTRHQTYGCSLCENEQSTGHKFCPKCGQKLGQYEKEKVQPFNIHRTDIDTRYLEQYGYGDSTMVLIPERMPGHSLFSVTIDPGQSLFHPNDKYPIGSEEEFRTAFAEHLRQLNECNVSVEVKLGITTFWS
jgi:hypothetical protein